MITVRKAAERGVTRFPWLDSRHSFSFGHYMDPAHVHWSDLRVINDDRIKGGGGFPPHSHRDMEIVTYMVSGALAHEDSTGGRETIGAGEVQRMTAGTGITHSEFNASRTEDARLLQIWLLPDKDGHAPGYEQKRFPRDDKLGRLLPVASGHGLPGALGMNQDADIFASVLAQGDTVTHDIAPGRRAWVQVVDGDVEVNGHLLAEGDGAAVADESRIEITSGTVGEFLLFDLA
ncbi:MAG: pirin family protein [Alphaproteobacteria bacterium]